MRVQLELHGAVQAAAAVHNAAGTSLMQLRHGRKAVIMRRNNVRRWSDKSAGTSACAIGSSSCGMQHLHDFRLCVQSHGTDNGEVLPDAIVSAHRCRGFPYELICCQPYTVAAIVPCGDRRFSRLVSRASLARCIDTRTGRPESSPCSPTRLCTNLGFPASGATIGLLAERGLCATTESCA
jgi:hypothetical protein